MSCEQGTDFEFPAESGEVFRASLGFKLHLCQLTRLVEAIEQDVIERLGNCLLVRRAACRRQWQHGERIRQRFVAWGNARIVDARQQQP